MTISEGHFDGSSSCSASIRPRKEQANSKNTGFSFTDEYGNQMVEYHVVGMVLEENEERWLADDSIVNRSAANVNLNNFGGNLSIRFPMGEKPLIIIGHDESIFKQYSFSKKDGFHQMASAFCIQRMRDRV